MANKKQIICFDASIIKSGRVGCGVYDMTNLKKVYKTFNTNLKHHESYKGEMMALVTAMEYMYANNIKNPYLFTDNLTLANDGIPDFLIEKYGEAQLYWIPREFNVEADLLSKKARNVKTTPIKDLNSTNIVDLSVSLRQFPKNKRANLLVRLAISDYQMELAQYFKNGKNKPTKINTTKDDKQFELFFNSIRKKGDMAKKKTSSLNKLFDPSRSLSSNQMNDLIRSRNII